MRAAPRVAGSATRRRSRFQPAVHHLPHAGGAEPEERLGSRGVVPEDEGDGRNAGKIANQLIHHIGPLRGALVHREEDRVHGALPDRPDRFRNGAAVQHGETAHAGGVETGALGGRHHGGDGRGGGGEVARRRAAGGEGGGRGHRAGSGVRSAGMMSPRSQPPLNRDHPETAARWRKSAQAPRTCPIGRAGLGLITGRARWSRGSASSLEESPSS